MSPAYSMNYQLVRGDELVELRDRLTKAERFSRQILELWADGEYGDVDGGLIQDAARASGYHVEVPSGSHGQECEACQDGAESCWELRLPEVEK